MLYTKGFLLAGMLAAALTLAACADVVEQQTTSERRTPLRLGALLHPSDVAALTELSTALESHALRHHELTEPDYVIARHARTAAAAATGSTRATLESLAASAQRSALAFLIDYHLAAGSWEQTTGVRMGSPGLETR